MLSLRLFGPLGLTVDGVDVPLGSIKQRALLALLALDAGRVVSTDRLIDELWPDAAPATATSTLQVYVSRLRRLFGESSADAVVVRRRPGYLLEIDPDSVDAHRVGRLVEAARAALRDASGSAALAASDEAVELTPGPPLAEFDASLGPTAAAEVERLTELAVAAREVRADALLLADRPAEAAQVAAALIDRSPLRENAHVLLMRSLYRSGRAADALAAYARVRSLLDEELGTEPGPALRRVHAQILRHDPALEPADADTAGAGVTTAEAARPVATPAAPRESAGSGRERLLGRDDVLTVLNRLLDGARIGRGALRVLDGEAGIGKTSVANALAAVAAQQGFTVAWGRADEAAVDVAFWPWQRIFTSLPALHRDGAIGIVLGSPDLDLTPGPAAQLRLITGLATGLLASTEPTLVLFEDIHWADDLSLTLLAAVAERCADSRVVVLCTNRVEASGPRLVELFARLARVEAAERVTIDGLSVADVAALIGRHAVAATPSGVADRVHARTEGNPFYVTELLRAATADGVLDAARLGGEVPGTVRDVVTARVAALPAAAKRLLDVAAVAAPVDDLEVLAQVADLDADALDQGLEIAVSAGLLRERMNPRPTVAFAHSLIRETLNEQLRPSVRARMHAATATALLGVRPGDTSDDLVHHLLTGQALLDPMVVLPPVLAAAARAMNNFAMIAAEDMLRRALSVLDGLPAGTARRELEMTVHTSFGLSIATRVGWASAEADESLAYAARLAQDAAPGPGMVGAFLYRGAMLTTGGRFAELDVLLRGAERRAEEPGVHAAALHLLSQVGRGSMDYQLGRIDEAVATLGAAVAATSGELFALPLVVLSNLGLPARSFLGMSLACLPGRAEEALDIAQDAVRLSADDTPLDRSAAHLWRSIVAATLRDHKTAEDDSVRAREYARAAGTQMYDVFGRIVLGWTQASTPEHGAPGDERRQDGARMIAAAHQEYRSSGAHGMDAVMWCLLAEAYAGAGRDEQARATARNGQAAAAALGSTLWHDRLAELAD